MVRVKRQFRIAGLAAGVLALLPLAYSQIPSLGSAPAAEKKGAAPDPLGRDTPYGCVVGFLRAAEREEYSRAVEYLDIKPSPEAQVRARQLRSILNAGGIADVESVAKTPEGRLDDGLPADRENIGTMSSSDGAVEIVLERVQRGGRPIWLFSAETLRHVPSAVEHSAFEDLEKYVPQALRETRLFSLPLYRWLGTILGIALAMGVASLAAKLLFPCIRPVVRHVTKEMDDRRLDALRAPLWLILFALGFRFLEGVSLTLLGRRFWSQLSGAMAVFGLTWLVIRISDVVAERANRRFAARQATSKLAVVALLHRLLKIAIAIAGVVAIVYVAGGDITALLAGVGLGGIVIALAAQKTLENLFGGVAVISDEPIRVGDVCRFGDKLGTVEDIGLRSTRVRTLDRTMLSIPNGQLSVMNLENLTFRDMFLLNHKIGLRYETTPAQMRKILCDIRELIRTHPKVNQEGARVRLVEFAASAFTIEIFLYLRVDKQDTYLEEQEKLLLDILDIVVAAGSGLAFPSQTVYVTRDKPNDSALVEQAADRIEQRRLQPALDGPAR